MTTRTSTAPGTSATSRSILAKVTVLEAKLMLRDGATVFFGLIFPALLLVGLGLLIPDFQETLDDGSGLRGVDIYAPVALTLAIATVGIVLLPTYLATYRGQGVLRRLATTPASPSVLLNAQLIVNIVILVAGSLLAVVGAILLLDVELPQNWPSTLIAFALSAMALFSIGLMIGAVAKNGKAANAISMSAYFPLLFFAGVWTPGDTMPDGVRAIADFTPTGAASVAMNDAWLNGDWPSMLHLLVLIGWIAVAGFVAARTFRWE